LVALREYSLNGSVAQLDRATASKRGRYVRNNIIEPLEFGETLTCNDDGNTELNLRNE